MTVLMIFLIVFNAIMIAVFIGAVISCNMGDSKRRMELLHENERLSCSHKHIRRTLLTVLNEKTVKYKGKVFAVKSIDTYDNGDIEVELIDKLGFTQKLNINDLYITEKE